MATRVALIGCGTIGRFLALRMGSDPDVELVAIIEPETDRLYGLERFRVDSVEELLETRPALVVEAAGADVVRSVAPLILSHVDMLVLSASAFCDQAFEARVSDLCQDRAVYIPHGAVLGLDGLSDSRETIEAVQITTTKKPGSLGRDDVARTVAYEGTAREACRLYPRNVNVHAAVALAGLGFDRTRSRIVSDPDAAGNRHEIEVKGQGFGFRVEIVSEPRGLVTSAYTLLSAYNSMRGAIVRPRGIVIC